MQQRSIWQRAAAGLAVAGLMIGATVALAQITDIQDRLIRIAPDQGSEQLEIEPFPGEDRLIDVPKHWIGLGVGPLPELLRTHLRLGDNEGVLVVSVIDQSPAAQAGLAKDDVLVSAAGKSITDARDLVEVVREQGDRPFDLEVIHQGERSIVRVTPVERPEEFAAAPLEREAGDRFWQIDPRDMPDVRQWLERLPQGGGRLDFRAMGPGMLFDGDRPNLENLPSGMSVQIFRQGDQPATVKVQKNGQTWEFQADDQEALEQLPDDVRNVVKGTLGRRGNGWSFGPGNFPDADWLPRFNLPQDRGAFRFDESDLDKRVRGLEARLEKLLERLAPEE